MELFDIGRMRALLPDADELLAFSLALTELAPQYGVNTPRRAAAFIAQTGHETGGYTRWVENTNYSAAGLAATWPKRFAKRGPAGTYMTGRDGKLLPNDAATALHRQPERIANVVYANRLGNGDVASGDGFRYRGRGLIQLTGKATYDEFAAHLGHEFMPTWLELPRGAAWSALWFWKTRGCNELADKWDVVGLTKRINGGTNGLSDRRARHAAAAIEFGVAV